MGSTPIQNSPDVWRAYLPRPAVDGHKYHRGFAAVIAAAELTGATRLAATACSRIGCGLVSVVARQRSDIYRMTLPPDIMVQSELPEKTSVLLGGSGGITAAQTAMMLAASGLTAKVFDAGAMPHRKDLAKLDTTCILTPHTGEFTRAFGSITTSDCAAAKQIARQSGATVVLKSAQTVVASADGRVVLNTHTSPYLAKAGTGDVLAGLIAGLAAQGMPHFEACCAGVWIHGEAGRRIGAGLIAGDISDQLPDILKDFL